MVDVPSWMNTYPEVLRPMRNWAPAAAVMNATNGWLPETFSGSSNLIATPSVSVLVPGMVRESRRWELPECRKACPANRPAGSKAPLVELMVQLPISTARSLRWSGARASGSEHRRRQPRRGVRLDT
jgi:hypothetical protein